MQIKLLMIYQIYHTKPYEIMEQLGWNRVISTYNHDDISKFGYKRVITNHKIPNTIKKVNNKFSLGNNSLEIGYEYDDDYIYNNQSIEDYDKILSHQPDDDTKIFDNKITTKDFTLYEDDLKIKKINQIKNDKNDNILHKGNYMIISNKIPSSLININKSATKKEANYSLPKELMHKKHTKWYEIMMKWYCKHDINSICPKPDDKILQYDWNKALASFHLIADKDLYQLKQQDTFNTSFNIKAN